MSFVKKTAGTKTSEIEDKSKPVYQLDYGDVDEVEENNSYVAIW